MAITHIPGETGEIVFDDRYAPIFTTTNKGVWQIPQLREWFVVSRREMLRVISEGKKVFFIGDISNVASPDAVTRKAIADFQDEFDVPFKGNDTFIGQCYVISNPLMRGLVTAVNWMTGGFVAPHFTAPTMRSALRVAEQCYEKRGLELPFFPDDYEFPAFKS